MYTITITQVEDGSIMLLSSDGTTAEKALELCLAAATMYRADVREEGEAAEASGGVGGVWDGLT